MSLSETLLDAARRASLRLIAPDRLQQRMPELARLQGALRQALGGVALAEVRQDGERRDVTLLAEATGWDERAIELAAAAARYSAETELSEAVLYALFRAGVPAHPQQVARLDGGTFRRMLEAARAAGVVDLGDDELAAAATRFDRFSHQVVMDTAPEGALAAPGALLGQTGLSAAEQASFASLYVTHRQDPEALWRAAAEALPAARMGRLRLHGKLAFLTGNNAALIADLQRELAPPSGHDEAAVNRRLAELVDRDLDTAAGWRARIEQLAGGDDARRAALVPPSYVAGDEEARCAAYAEELARQVRLSFPTHVVRRMVERDELRLGARHADLKGHVAGFLRTAAAHGFELGATPVEGFVRRNRAAPLFAAGMTEPERQEALAAVKRLARLYQITPSDAGLQVLLDADLSSAQEVAALPEATFVQSFGARFASPEEARGVHRQARRVRNVTTTFVATSQLAAAAPSIYALSPPEPRRAELMSLLGDTHPSLPTLLGSLDFCECQDCRSVLSPAAYYVELLEFLERAPAEWTTFFERWRTDHGGARYPYSQSAWELLPAAVRTGYQEATPFEVLAGRRPNLPELALSCENTNVVLPYIDLANEILEYYVANQKPLDHPYNIGAETSADLLAEPQHVLTAAYDTVGRARYPLALPFDLDTATLRRFCDYFSVPLWQVLEALRPSDDLTGADPARAYRLEVFAESLGLTADEHRLFTDATTLGDLAGLYGYDPGTDVPGRLAAAPELARRLGVTYVELVELLKTDFINPSGSTASRLVLHDDSTACSFEQTTLRRQGGPAIAADFLRLNLLVRLWRKLGWSLAEVDRALGALLVPVPDFGRPADVATGLRAALLYLAHVAALEARLGPAAGGRAAILALLAGAANREASFARAAGLSAAELASLQALTGLAPFPALAANPTTLAADGLYSQTLRLLEIADRVRASGLSIEDLDYLLRHELDPLGKYRDVAAGAEALRAQLAEGHARIVAEEQARARDPMSPGGDLDELVRRYLVDTVVSALGAEASLGAALLQERELLSDPDEPDPGKRTPLLEVLRGIVARGAASTAAEREQFRRLLVLVDKVLRLAAGLELSLKELRYVLGAGRDAFGGIDLSRLPTVAKISDAQAQALFGWISRLIDYTALRRDLAADGADVVDLFAAARVPLAGGLDGPALLDALYRQTAILVRQRSAAVRAVAVQLGLDRTLSAAGFVSAPDFAGERGLRRLWDVLQLAQRLGGLADPSRLPALLSRLAAARFRTPGRGPEPPRRDAVAVRRRELAADRQGDLRPAAPAEARRAGRLPPPQLRPARGHARGPVRALPARSGDRGGGQDLAPPARDLDGAAVRPALRDEPGAGGPPLGDRRGRVAVAEAISGLGGQSQDLPVPGELDGARTPRRQERPVPGDRGPAPAGGRVAGAGGGRLLPVPEEARARRPAGHRVDVLRGGPGGPRAPLRLPRHRPDIQRSAQVLLPALRPRHLDAVGGGGRGDRGRSRRRGGLARATAPLLADLLRQVRVEAVHEIDQDALGDVRHGRERRDSRLPCSMPSSTSASTSRASGRPARRAGSCA